MLTPWSVFRTVTIAPLTVAPDGSVTSPRIDPVISCALAVPHSPAPSPTTNNKTSKRRISHLLDLSNDFKLSGQTIHDLATVSTIGRFHKLDRLPVMQIRSAREPEHRRVHPNAQQFRFRGRRGRCFGHFVSHVDLQSIAVRQRSV